MKANEFFKAQIAADVELVKENGFSMMDLVDYHFDRAFADLRKVSVKFSTHTIKTYAFCGDEVVEDCGKVKVTCAFHQWFLNNSRNKFNKYREQIAEIIKDGIPAKYIENPIRDTWDMILFDMSAKAGAKPIDDTRDDDTFAIDTIISMIGYELNEVYKAA